MQQKAELVHERISRLFVVVKSNFGCILCPLASLAVSKQCSYEPDLLCKAAALAAV